MSQAAAIRDFLLHHVDEHPRDIVAVTVEHFSVTRTTVLRHMRKLIDQGLIVKTGRTKQVAYHLASATRKYFSVMLDSDFDEFRIFNEHFSSLIKAHCSQQVYDICEYGFTEMMNNCKDHSRGGKVALSIVLDMHEVRFSCQDDGVGVFKNLAGIVASDEVREVMLELSKGKLTTDASNHTGEGIFFTSRAFDCFMLTANGFCYIRDNEDGDWSFVRAQKSRGTLVELRIQKDSRRNLIDIFTSYQDPDSMEFAKTEVIVDLAREYGKRLISRSQAHRITRNLESFSYVTLNFKHVEAVGQGFVDQVFRVFVEKTPNVSINYINASEDVDFMIRRGIQTARRQYPG